MSDNGPCYTAEAFTKTMQEYRVNHITSSPHYPQSNGLAGKFVQTVKNLFDKAREEGADIYKALMIYCNMPLTSNLPCRSCKIELLDHNCPCPTVLEDSLVWKLKRSGQNQKMRTCHCMTCTWVKTS